MATKEKSTVSGYIQSDPERAKDEALAVKSVEECPGSPMFPQALELVGGAGAAARALASNKGFHIEQVVPLRQGDSVDGVYVGPGGDIQLKDDSLIPSWRVALTPQVTAILVGTYKLNQFFRGIPIGTRVIVEHKGKDATGKVNQYFCVTFKEEKTTV